MKKYLMTGIAALAMCAGFTSCSHDLSNPTQEEIDQFQAEKDKRTYEAAFLNYVGGTISPDQDWGFGNTSNARALTRAITVNGDVYDKFPSTADVAANFPTAIPQDAKTDEELEAEWKGKYAVDENGEEIIASWGGKIQMWDLYAIYMNMVGKVIKNIKVTTPGEFTVGNSWANPADRVYNVYISVGNGNKLTLKRNGAEHVNFYIMSGEVTIASDFGECGGIISVAEGATVNDQRNHIAHNDGVKVFNKGTYNATNTTTYWNGSENTSVFDIGNFCKFYNEGKFVCSSGISYSPGDSNDSYFMNLGDDAELTATSMTLNSTGNFFNSGKVNITGETKVTQARLYWVNAGHYTTGSMTFSAKNTTFYNYCQLIVKGNAHMYDGEFNLMANSYTEAASAEFDNFIVNMDSNTGMNIKGTVNFIAQGDGTYQGFRTNGGSNDYLLIGGKVTVASHKKTFSVSSGITYSINQIEIIKNGNVVTEEYLQSIGDGDYPVLDLNGTECPYGQLTVTPNTNSCGATWNKKNNDPANLRVMAEDLNATGDDDTDFDFNDVVFDVYFAKSGETSTKVIIRAAGGILPLRIAKVQDPDTNSESDWVEVHNLFQSANPGKNCSGMMINTNGTSSSQPSVRSRSLDGLTCPELTLTWAVTNNADANNIIIQTFKKSWITIEARIGEPAAKFAVSPSYGWMDERESIKGTVSTFTEWVSGNGALVWPK